MFEKHQLVRLWIAQGFIAPSPASGSRDIEEEGAKYFNDLVGISVFQTSASPEDGKEMYVMHDLFHELAQLVAGDEFCRTEGYELSKMDYRTRHFSLSPSEAHSEKLIQFEPFDGQYLRSFLFIARFGKKLNEFFFTIKIAENIFARLQCLRALDLKNTDIAKLPKSIAILKHLRYFCLGSNKITSLPESLCYLYNLRILDLRHCNRLEELPQRIKHLLNLVHLKLPLENYLHVCMPSGIGKLTRLQTMSAFIVRNDRMCCGLSELKDLIDLKGELHIGNLNYIIDARDAEEANLKNKERLQKLTLQWSRCFGSSSGIPVSVAEMGFKVLDKLQPPYSIRVLNVRDYYGFRFPNWLGDPCYSKLVCLNLQECAECIELPSLGHLPSLRFLTVHMMNGVTLIGREFHGNTNGTHGKGFQKLERLEFRKMLEWKEWSGVEDGDFPRLHSLVINDCPKLDMLPKLDHLMELVVHSCEKMHSLPKFPMLEVLYIDRCQQLVSIPGLQHLSSLRQLKVTECPKLDISLDIKLNLNCNISAPCFS